MLIDFNQAAHKYDQYYETDQGKQVDFFLKNSLIFNSKFGLGFLSLSLPGYQFSHLYPSIRQIKVNHEYACPEC